MSTASRLPRSVTKAKRELRREHRELDAIGLARSVEQKLVVIYGILERIEEERELTMCM